jgi:peptidyl-prolyl cis-trans isomerase D
LIEDKASPADETEVKTKINSLLLEVWFTTKLQVKKRCQDLELLQTIDFVNSNSDVPYDSTYIAKKDLPAVDADKLFNLLQVLFMGRIYLENTTVFLNL